jgi:hypothetical protein
MNWSTTYAKVMLVKSIANLTTVIAEMADTTRENFLGVVVVVLLSIV